MINLTIHHVHSFNRNSIPEEHENVLMDIPELITLINDIKNISIYYRTPEECPFARGNWICDIQMPDFIFAIKLPREMSNAKVLKFFEPLINACRLNELKINSKIH